MKNSLIVLLIVILYGCGGGEDKAASPTPSPTPTPTPSLYSLAGDFQKGPFIIGTEINIQEFDASLVATGNIYQTEMINNAGHYQIDLNLTKEIVEVSADGYYFNEVSGQLSDSQLRLSALANASNNENININILTHLSKKRIKTLVSDGKDFSVAKKQAEKEVQELFSFVTADWEINDFDRMSISEYGDNNSYLLLVSAIIQNINMSTSQLSEYIERLAQDLSDNGVVNDNTLIESINLSAQTVNLSMVKTNLITRYNELGEAVNLPDFESLLNRKPIADAGDDLIGLVGVETALNGSGSTDIDGDSLTYNWLLIESPEGSIATLTGDDLISPSLTPDISGNYQVSLTVSDAELTSDTDIINVSTNNRAPFADAGEDFIKVVGESITLDGSNSYDLDGDILTYQWTSLTDGISVNGTGAVFDAGVIPSSTLTDSIPDTVTFSLFVTDSSGFSDEDNVTITYKANLIDNNNGTVSDGFGNMWQQGESETFTAVIFLTMSHLTEGQSYCSNLIIAQYDDWRVPTVSELYKLVDMDVGSPTINTNYFPTTVSGFYATNTSIGGGLIDYFQVVDFENGSSTGSYEGETTYNAKCVR